MPASWPKRLSGYMDEDTLMGRVLGFKLEMSNANIKRTRFLVLAEFVTALRLFFL